MVLLLATLAAWPLLTRPGLVTLTDAHHHALRTYELMQGWHSGVAYPRWAPDFYYGFGYPVFNYYAVLTYYVAGAYALLFDPVAGVKLVLVLSAYLGPVGVYLFARDLWGEARAAVVAAAVYAYAPYIALINPLMRGAAPETLATAMAPLVFWTWTRLARPGGRGFFLPATLALAALVLAHNLMPFVYLPLLGAWLAWQALWGGARPDRGALERLAGAGALALGLTAFMWLPALVERGAVQYANAFTEVLARRYVTWAELFQPVTRADMEPFGIADYSYRLGLPQWALGLAGALTLLRPNAWRRVTLFWALVTATLLLVAVPQADALWQAFAPLRYLQFSFRLLGALALSLALLAGAAALWAADHWRWLSPAGWAAGLVALTLAFGLRLLNPLPWPPFPPITRAAIMDFEVGGLWGVGTTWQGEFLPVGVRAKPAPRPEMQAAVAAGGVEKVDRAALPAGVGVALLEHAAQRDTFATDAPDAFTLRVLTFAWPGWTAYVDGVQTPIGVSDPEGWITVAVPGGAHIVTVQLEETAPRKGAWLLSFVAVGVLLGVGAREIAQRRARPETPPAGPQLAGRAAALLAVVAAGGLVARYALDVGIRWQARTAWPSGAAQTAATETQVAAQVNFDNQLALAAYDLPQTSAHPGDTVRLTVDWLKRGNTTAPASVFVHFYGPDGKLWGQSDKPDPIVVFPTTRWPLGRVMVDEHQATLKPDAPPGVYRVAVGWWDRATGQRSHPLGADGRPLPEDVYTLTDSFVVTP